jgi:hypothetical protein
LVRDPSMKERMLEINVPLQQLIELDDVYGAQSLKPLAERKADQTIKQFNSLIQ